MYIEVPVPAKHGMSPYLVSPPHIVHWRVATVRSAVRDRSVGSQSGVRQERAQRWRYVEIYTYQYRAHPATLLLYSYERHDSHVQALQMVRPAVPAG
jgi:hypothetical protein